MKTALPALGLALILINPALPAAPAAGEYRQTFERFVGEWHMDLATDPVTFEDQGGPGTGIMSCAWGPGEIWVDCNLVSNYEKLGRYYLKIVLYPLRGDTVGAFVTNSFGGGRLYTGRMQPDGRLVYEDAWIDPSRNWEHQRTTYTFHDVDRLSFTIEVSRDGERYLPHSRGIYRRDRPGATAR